MKKTTWLSEMKVGNAEIDAAHKALFDQMLCVFRARDNELSAGILSLTDKLERDFCAEEALMEGLDFPGLHSHREEHARVLSALHHIDPCDAAAAREAVQLMLRWFPAHVATMDAALVAARRPAAIPARNDDLGEPSAEQLRLMADTMPGEGPGD